MIFENLMSFASIELCSDIITVPEAGSDIRQSSSSPIIFAV